MKNNHSSRFGNTLYRTLTALITCAFLWSASGLHASARNLSVSEGAHTLAVCLNNGQARSRNNPDNDTLTFVGTDPGKAIPKAVGLSENASPEAAARSYLSRCGSLFGLTDQATDLHVQQQKDLDHGRSLARFQQYYQGIPVMGGELVVNLDNRKNISSVGGKIFPDLSVGTQPSISAADAEQAALNAVAGKYNLQADHLQATTPELWIYDPSLFGAAGTAVLVWRMDVTPPNELVLVDAHSGAVALSFNQTDNATLSGQTAPTGKQFSPGTNSTSRNAKALTLGTPMISVYSMNNYCQIGVLNCTGDGTQNLTNASLLCNQSNYDPSHPDTWCGGDTQAQDAYQYALDTYNFYATVHGRDSLNNIGEVIKAYVHYGKASPVGFPDASWDGFELLIGEGWSAARDIVAHELTHGVTGSTSKLYNYYQSGAISESFSDLWGEFIDQVNGDSGWMIGESLSGGAIRNMADPTTPPNPCDYGSCSPGSNPRQPDKMTNSYYYQGANDNGGVHINSGINNKAVYLMTQGGTFNSVTITALDPDLSISRTKTAKIYYEVQTNLLTSGADYKDLAAALYQGCLNLVYTNGITLDNCAQVQAATQAVEMTQQPAAGYNPEASLCGSNFVPHDLFYDGAESDPIYDPSTNTTGKFEAAGILSSPNQWSWKSGNAHTGVGAIYADDTNAVTNSYVKIKNAITLEANSYLYFAQSFLFYALDGGVVEYSTDDGANWSDATALDVNFYNSGSAFTGDSHGYISNLLDLSSLPADTQVTFRWRQTTSASDPRAGVWGWFLDDIRVYTCVAETAPGAFNKTSPTNGGGASVNPTLSWAPSAGATGYEYCFGTDSSVCDPITGTWTPAGNATSKKLSGLTQDQTYYWHVRATNPSTAATPTYANGSNTAFWSFTVGCYKLTTNKTLTTNFTPPSQYGSLNINPTPTCDSNTKYTEGTEVTITAVPASNLYRLKNWSGDASGYVRMLTITMTSDKSVTANFADSFSDIPSNYSASVNGVSYHLAPYIEALLDNGFTNGCNTNPFMFCPTMILNRGMAAKFLLNVMHGASYTAPNPPDNPVFLTDNWARDANGNDGSWARPWAEQMKLEGLTSGCNLVPLLYCPWSSLPRDQAVKFALTMEYGDSTGSFLPLATGEIYADVTCTAPTCWATPWIEQAYREGLLPPCGTSGSKPLFCPSAQVNRAWAAYLIVKAMKLNLPYPPTSP